MNPVLDSQAKELMRICQNPVQAHMFLERACIPYDVQDLIFAALSSIQNPDQKTVAAVLEFYISINSFEEGLIH